MKIQSICLTISLATFSLVAAFSANVCHAQVAIQQEQWASKVHDVTMELADSVTKSPVAFATVYMQHVKDTVITNFTLSDMDGKVVLKDVTTGRYDLYVEFMGYIPVHREFQLNKDLNLGKILLKPDVKAIEAAKVTAAGNLVEIKKDTIVYNASMIHTGADDKLVDLLRKMPGIEVGKNGSLKVNGKSVSQITVGGKNFFMGDNSIALNNLPASVVDKVKVVDKESEAAEFTGIKDDKKKTVMDVQLKDEYKNGLFGNLSGGLGTCIPGKDKNEFLESKDLLYRASGLISAYGEKTQLTAIASAQNARSEDDAYVVNRAEDNYSKTLPFGGVPSGWQVGANVNTDKIKGYSTDATAVFKGGTADLHERSQRTTFRETGDLLSSDDSRSTGDSQGFAAKMELKKKDTKKYTFKFSPSIQLTNYHYSTVGESSSSVLDEVKNSSNSSSVENQRALFTSGNLTFGVKNLGKKRRSITVTGAYTFGTYDGDSREYSKTEFASGAADIRDLHYDNTSMNYSYGGSFQYVEPIGKFWAVQGFVSSYYKVKKSDRNAFNADSTSNEYYTSRSRNYYITNYGRVLMQYSKAGSTLQFGGLVRVINNENHARSYGLDTKTGVGEWTTAWSPFVKFSTSGEKLYFDGKYAMDSSRPSTNSITPAFNILNPTRITAGNIYLSPSFEHNLRFYLDGTIKKKTSYSVNAYGAVTKDDHVSATWFDGNNVRYSVPVNARNPSYSVQAYVFLNRKLTKDGKLSASLNAGGMLRKQVSYQSVGTLPGIDLDNLDYKSFMSSFWGDNSSGERFYSGESGFKESNTRKYSWDAALTFRYSLEKVQFVAGADVTNSISRYSLDSKANTNTWNNEYNAGVMYNAPWDIDMETRLSYHTYHGYGSGYNDPYWDWRIFISKSVKAFTFKISFEDILNQQKVLWRSVMDDYAQDTYRNTLGRSILFTATWNFGKMNAQKARNSRSAMFKMAF